jgi:hypothetical protein
MKVRVRYLFFLMIGILLGAEISAKPILKSDSVNPGSIKKIHLIFKTHLDVGFTNFGDSVIKTYMDDFIPRTLSLTESLRQGGASERYLWTTGSWLIYEFLKQSDTVMVKRMEKAIKNGDITWHALPFSTHTELADPSLYELGIQISKQLDKRFGKNTISAKMTDVPGHTRSIVPILARNGIKFLHIGVNSASTAPDVPPLFRWQAPDGTSVIVMYQQGYGNQIVLPGTDVMVDIRFTNDNHGPHSLAQIKSIYKELHEKYPNAEVVTSTLNDVAYETLKIESTLPVITKELGDTWIHGVGSDPALVSDFRALSRLRLKWINEGKFAFGDEQDLSFGLPLLMVAEHTWGRDVKVYLKDWDIYLPADFKAARLKSNFKQMEQSWNEKRRYINRAIDNLPLKEKKDAWSILRSLKPSLSSVSGYSELKDFSKIVKTKYYEIKISPSNGSIIYLRDKKSGQNWANGEHPLFLYSYQTFSNTDYERFLNQYLIKKVQWALEDFGKPGLEKLNLVSKIWNPTLVSAHYKEDKSGTSVLLKMSVLDDKGQIVGGSPAEIYVELTFPNDTKEIQATLKWFGKQAYRLPEASWFSFAPVVRKGDWTIDKMGGIVNFRDVESRGNRKMHACINGVQLKTIDGATMSVGSLDAPLAMFGNSSLLDFNNKLPNAGDGVQFCLHNNVWGTNFTMWFDEDMQYRFVVKL